VNALVLTLGAIVVEIARGEPSPAVRLGSRSA